MDNIDYYAGGFRRTFGGAPCKVFSRRMPDGRFVNAKDSPYYVAVFDDPKNGISRLSSVADVLAAQEALAAAPKRRTVKKAATPVAADISDDIGIVVAATVVPVEAAVAVEAPELAQRVETAPAPAVAQSAPISDPTVAALVARIEALERGQAVRAALIAAAANDVAPVVKRTEREERAIRRAWRIRCEARALRDLDVRALEAANACALAERERVDHYQTENAALRASVDTLVQRVDDAQCQSTAAQRRAHSVGEQLQGAQRRADRLARVAVDQRKRVARLQSDLAGAKAETRAMARRADDARARYAVAHPSPTPPPPTDTVMAVAFATAR